MDGINIKCQCARLERPSTGSWMTITNRVVSPLMFPGAIVELKLKQGEGVLMKDGLTFAQWEFIAIKHFPQWELDHICDCALLED